MKKTIVTLLLCAVIFSAAAPSADALEKSQTREIGIYIDGEPASFGGRTVLIENRIYVPVWDIAVSLGADSVIWNKEEGTAVIKYNGCEMRLAEGDLYTEANGRYFYLYDGCRTVDGFLMVPLRTIAYALGAEVCWSEEEHAAYVISGMHELVSGDEFYNEDDIYWLSRIISAEARGESFEGQIAVGNVILNRVADEEFPNTVYGVIFDRRFGIQFTPAYSGAVYTNPAEPAVIAAKLAYEGFDVVGDSLYFSSAESCWASYHRKFVTELGNHTFYA